MKKVYVQNTGSAFKIGSAHKVCEDYAISGVIENKSCEELIYYTCISDGCSGAPNTDIGARLLLHAFKTFFSNACNIKTYTLCPEYLYNDITSYITTSVDSILQEMGLPLISMTATLRGIVVIGDFIFCVHIGDGYTRINDKIIFAPKFPDEKPYYLFNMSLVEHQFYKNIQGKKIITDIANDDVDVETYISTYNNNFYYVVDVNELSIGYNFLTVASDGFDSFINSSTRKSCCDVEMIDRILKYKNLMRNFVKLRLFKEISRMKEYEHTDDVSVGTIHIKIEEE